MTAISKNIYFDVLDGIVNKYNNTVHKTIKIKPIDVISDSYAECNEDSNEKLVSMLISRNKNIFSKGYAPNWSAEVFVVI